MCKVLYKLENLKYFRLKTKRNPLDGKLYITNCIN
jgi:hypothetical protein